MSENILARTRRVKGEDEQRGSSPAPEAKPSLKARKPTKGIVEGEISGRIVGVTIDGAENTEPRILIALGKPEGVAVGTKGKLLTGKEFVIDRLKAGGDVSSALVRGETIDSVRAAGFDVLVFRGRK